MPGPQIKDWNLYHKILAAVKDEHPDWSEERQKSLAAATANKRAGDKK